jgi:hypothetical protein
MRSCNDRLTADSQSVVALTEHFVRGSARYRAIDSHERAVADAALTRTTTGLSAPTAFVVDDYKAGVARLARDGWLNAAQAAILRAFADSL